MQDSRRVHRSRDINTQHLAEFHILQSVPFSQLLQFQPTNAQNVNKITLHAAELPDIPTGLVPAETTTFSTWFIHLCAP